MKLIRVLAAVALLLTLPGVHASRAFAQGAGSPEALATAKELFSILSKDMMTQMVTQMSAQVWPVIERSLAAKNVDQATLAELHKEFDRIQSENLTVVMQDAPPIYARYFTAAELNELASFYRTAVGQKALKILPEVTGEFMRAMMPRLQEVQFKTQQSFERVLRDKGYLK